MSKKHDLLINTEDILIVLTPLAVLIGDREAIALQQVHYWLEINRKGEKVDTHFIEDKWWAYNTWKGWQEKNFPFWSIATIQRVFESLGNKGLVILRDHENRNKGKWVTIIYGELETLKSANEPRRERVSKRVRSSKTARPKKGRRSSQTDMTGLVKLTTPPSQTDMTTGTTDTNADTTSETSIASDAAKPKKLSEHQLMSDAIVQAFGWDWSTMTDTSKKHIGKVARELREAKAKPHHIAGVYVYCDEQFDNITPAALSKHWAAYVKEILNGKLDDTPDEPAPAEPTYTREQLGLPPMPEVDYSQFANMTPEARAAHINAMLDELEREKGLPV